MSEPDNWLSRYGDSHATLHNPIVYWIAVPMLVVGVVGILWSLPVPQQFHEISPLLNWGSAFLMVTAIYYFIISLSLAIGMLPFLLGLASIQVWLTNSPWPLRGVAIGLMVAGVAGLALGRAGNLRAVLEDLQLVMIGPLWLLASIYNRFRIPV